MKVATASAAFQPSLGVSCKRKVGRCRHLLRNNVVIVLYMRVRVVYSQSVLTSRPRRKYYMKFKRSQSIESRIVGRNISLLRRPKNTMTFPPRF